MPWQEVSVMSQRKEFIALAIQDRIGMRELCRRFRISPKTGYKWLQRYRETGEQGLMDRSRRPRGSPGRTPFEVEQQVLALRQAHPAWGGRKLGRRLRDLGVTGIPSPGTITAILHRHGLIDAAESEKHKPWQRFEHEAPNQLWQMDFKGHFPLAQGRCHPLTVLDDHSRYALGLEACGDEQATTVRRCLTSIFRRHGLPDRMLMDNGPPWGNDADSPHTVVTVWLMRLGIRVAHGRPYHPQTQGKDERFHRTLTAEVLSRSCFADLALCQRRFDHWRVIYNTERPHEALDDATPATRYRPSPKPFPETLPAIEYASGDAVRKVQGKGEIHYRGRVLKIGRAFHGYPVAIRPTVEDGVMTVHFCHELLATLDLRSP